MIINLNVWRAYPLLESLRRSLTLWDHSISKFGTRKLETVPTTDYGYRTKDRHLIPVKCLIYQQVARGCGHFEWVDWKKRRQPRAPLTYFNDEGSEWFFGVWNFCQKWFFGFMKDAGIFLGREKKQGFLWVVKKGLRDFWEYAKKSSCISRPRIVTIEWKIDEKLGLKLSKFWS